MTADAHRQAHCLASFPPSHRFWSRALGEGTEALFKTTPQEDTA